MTTFRGRLSARPASSCSPSAYFAASFLFSSLSIMLRFLDLSVGSNELPSLSIWLRINLVRSFVVIACKASRTSSYWSITSFSGGDLKFFTKLTISFTSVCSARTFPSSDLFPSAAKSALSAYNSGAGCSSVCEIKSLLTLCFGDSWATLAFFRGLCYNFSSRCRFS